MSVVEPLPARLLGVRRHYIAELTELLGEISDPQHRESISDPAVRALVADFTEEAARDGEAACRLWEKARRDMAAAGADDPAYRRDVGIALQLSLRHVQLMRDLCRDMAAAGHPVSFDADLDRIIADLRDRLVETERSWPPTEGPAPEHAHLHGADADNQDGVGERFRKLADLWRKETGMHSSMSKRLGHPAYREIIALGEKVLPLILRELRDRPDHWFEALKAITKQTPVTAEERADPKKARAAWLRWGKDRGLID